MTIEPEAVSLMSERAKIEHNYWLIRRWNESGRQGRLRMTSLKSLIYVSLNEENDGAITIGDVA